MRIGFEREGLHRGNFHFEGRFLDTLMFAHNGKLLAIKVMALGARRGPASEARSLYSELDADAFA